MWLVIIAAVYIIAVGVLIYAWGKWNIPAEDDFAPKVSIVVAYRNELANLSNLIRDISKQNYPSQQMELILVNDHSDDDSQLLAAKACETYLNCDYQLLDVDIHKQGKKSALQKGVEFAKHDIILCTDADCRVSENWVNKITKSFAKAFVLFVSGPVVFDNKSFKNKLFHLEFLSLIGVGASALAMNKAVMANGANMAFRKNVFQRLKPYNGNLNVPSGDDEFLFKGIHKAYKHSCCFLKDAEAVVTTHPPANLKEFMQQRKRWAAKWRAHKKWSEMLLPILVFIFQLILLSLPFLFISGLITLEIMLTTLLMRAFIEFVFLKQVHEDLEQQFSWGAFLFWQLFYPFYAVFFGLFSNVGSYQWKNRAFSVQHNTQNEEVYG